MPLRAVPTAGDQRESTVASERPEGDHAGWGATFSCTVPSRWSAFPLGSTVIVRQRTRSPEESEHWARRPAPTAIRPSFPGNAASPGGAVASTARADPATASARGKGGGRRRIAGMVSGRSADRGRLRGQRLGRTDGIERQPRPTDVLGEALADAGAREADGHLG